MKKSLFVLLVSVLLLVLVAGAAAETSISVSRYEDENGDCAYIPEGFIVSAQPDERTVRAGLVVIGLDGSEFVWIPTAGAQGEQLCDARRRV